MIAFTGETIEITGQIMSNRSLNMSGHLVAFLEFMVPSQWTMIDYTGETVAINGKRLRYVR